MLALLAATLLAFTSAASPDSPGIRGTAVPPVPRGPVQARSLVAEVRLVEGIATNRLVLELVNTGPRQEEAFWVLPLGEGAVADDFRMRTGGVELRGEVLGADRARGVYEEIVRSRRDPGLLEHLGRGCLRARVFPVPPNGKVEVEVTWREILPEVGGLRRWSFPVAVAGLDGAPPEQVVLDLTVESSRALLNVFSHTPGLDVLRDGDHRARASFEGRGQALPSRELVLFHALTDREFGLDLLSTRAPSADEGTFLMLLSPRRDAPKARSMPRRIVFALDVSGSMKGRKIEQARGSLRFFLSALRPEDEFNVVPFSTEARPFFPTPVRADPLRVAEALRKVGGLEARGGTNLQDALRASLERAPVTKGRVPIVVLLSDGLPTVEERDPGRLLEVARLSNQGRARVFVFGVGDDVHTILLDRLAEDNGGTRSYVRPADDIELATSALFEALSHPVMTDLELVIEGGEVDRVVPRKLPDLFHGGRLIVAGRYRGAGHCAVHLTGTVGGERRSYVYEADLATGPVASFDFVPSLWAERRVAALLDEIRLHGAEEELVDEVRRLGTAHNIVTPYTSHLIVEEGLGVPRVAGGGAGAGGHGGGGTYRGPGDTRPPGAPGAGGPATPGPAAPGSPLGGGPAPATTSGGAVSVSIVDVLAERLRDAGVLPADAPPAELRRLAQEVATEMRASASGLHGLGRAESGQRAIEDSVWLERLTSPGGVTSGSGEFFLGRGEQGQTRSVDLLALFTRKVKGKVFVLRHGVWTDRGLPEGDPEPERVVVEAFSQAWFDLLVEQPALRPYFAFSTRLVVAHGDVVYEVRPPASEEEAAPTEEAAGSASR